MLFNSVAFIIFFISVTCLYFAIPHKFRWVLLLGSSCYFYMIFQPIYILILGFTIIIDYFAGIYIENAKGARRKRFLVISLIANIGVLIVFKYFNFLNDNVTSLLNNIDKVNPIPYLSILLPIGLSFHTFQAMSYTIEVFRGNQKAERSFGIYSLYVMFYPQLVAGPIERPQNMLHQFKEKHTFEYDNAVQGLKLMLWGFFKKIVIADRLAIYVNAVYGHPDDHGGMTFIVATIFFAFQIYCDFSGYSDIAIGAARVMGFKLMTNFNHPYFSESISEFWKRWHISLSTWFKDYVYIPLGGNQVKSSRIYFNLLIVFLLSGLWHGANWTYIIWGGLNGSFLVFAIVTKKPIIRIEQYFGLNKLQIVIKIINIVFTFILICFTWIFFRANNLEDAITIIHKILAFDGQFYKEDIPLLIYSIFGILFLILVESKREFLPHSFSFMSNDSWIVRHFTYSFLIVMILLFGVFDSGQFIYFQF